MWFQCFFLRKGSCIKQQCSTSPITNTTLEKNYKRVPKNHCSSSPSGHLQNHVRLLHHLLLNPPSRQEVPNIGKPQDPIFFAVRVPETSLVKHVRIWVKEFFFTWNVRRNCCAGAAGSWKRESWYVVAGKLSSVETACFVGEKFWVLVL